MITMNFGSLAENTSTLEALDKSNRNLAAQLAIAEESKAHEKSVQFLLNFEFSQIKKQMDEVNKEVVELEKEQRRLLATNQELCSMVKLIRNYFSFVNSLQVDRKEEHLQNLRGELSVLDFTIEQKQEEPSRTNDQFSQLARN